MLRIDSLFMIVLPATLFSSMSVSTVVAQVPGEEIVHSIFEYDIEYQERARAVVAEKMHHWAEESYVRWRPVRVEPSAVLEEVIAGDNAMPLTLQLTPFPDVIISAQRTRYSYLKATGDAIWEGVIPGIELSRVEITVVDLTDKPASTEDRIAFVIRIWDPPRHFYIHPTDDLDVYVAIEGRVADDTISDWAPNY